MRDRSGGSNAVVRLLHAKLAEKGAEVAKQAARIAELEAENARLVVRSSGGSGVNAARALVSKHEGGEEG